MANNFNQRQNTAGFNNSIGPGNNDGLEFSAFNASSFQGSQMFASHLPQQNRGNAIIEEEIIETKVVNQQGPPPKGFNNPSFAVD